MAQLPPAVMDALADMGALKVMATVDKAGVPNAVVVSTLAAVDPGTLMFADMRMGKTRANLMETKKFAVIVIKPPLEAYQIMATLKEFQERGELATRVNDLVWRRTQIQIRAVGLAKVDEVYSVSPGNLGERLA